MTEGEYLIATNRVKISLAKTIMYDVLAGDDWGISPKQKDEITRLLSQREMDLFSLISLKESK